MKKVTMLGILASLSFVMLAGLVVAQNNYQYGMMDSNGQFYKYGMMDSNNQFQSINPGYGMMGGMGGMMQMMTGYGGYGSGAILLSWITYLLTIALMAAGIYWLVKTASKR